MTLWYLDTATMLFQLLEWYAYAVFLVVVVILGVNAFWGGNDRR